MYQALYRKYRPRDFDEVVGQSHITETLKRQVEAGRFSHAYLFTGTRGTGKTTCAKILSRAVNCQAPVNGNPCNRCPSCLGIENGSILDVLELDAASNNGVDHVRALREDAVYTPAAVKKRVYIVDEVHMLSTAAFNALLKILEEPPAHLMFILATTELHKVPATIKSRCQQFAFKRILPGDIARHLGETARREGIDLTADGAALLARLADGGLRDAMSLLDQCAGTGGTVGEQEILDTLGLAGNLETAGLMSALAVGDTAAALETVDRLYAGGKEVKALLGELAGLTRDLLVRKTAPRGGSALLNGGYDETTLRKLSESLTAPRLVQMLSILQAAQADLARSGSPRTDAELCVIRLADETLDGGALGLSARVARLEKMMDYPPVRFREEPAVPADDAQAVEPPKTEPNRKPTVEAIPVTDEYDDPPPWDEDDVPPPEPPVFEEPAPPPTPAPPKTAEPPAPTPVTMAQPDGDLWGAVLAGAKGKVPPAAWPFLSNPAMTTAAYGAGVLTLTVDLPITKTMINKPEVLGVLAAQCEARTGGPVQVTVRLREEGPLPFLKPA